MPSLLLLFFSFLFLGSLGLGFLFSILFRRFDRRVALVTGRCGLLRNLLRGIGFAAELGSQLLEFRTLFEDVVGTLLLIFLSCLEHGYVMRQRPDAVLEID